MRSPSRILVNAVFAFVAMGLAACGGSQDAPPTPLAMHFDDMYIAQVPLDQKQSMVQTQQDWSIAKMENARTEADLNDATTQISIASNDQKRAQLEVESRVSAKKAADASADTARINDATKDLHYAEDALKAANERIKYLEAYRDYLRVQQRNSQEAMYWRESQFELAKARLGEKSGKAPKGVSYDAFPKQEEERRKRAESSKSRLDAAKGRAMTARDSWKKAQDASDRSSGRPSNFADPMGSKSTSNH
jgi:hypothetical protein